MEEGYTCMNGSRHSGSVSLSPSLSGSPVVMYSNQPSSAYLTPASPTPSQAPQLPAFPASFGLAQSSGPGQHRKNPLFPRADSGIEADSPRTPTSLAPSLTAAANPHASTLYEYIDPKDVHVEAQQNGARQGNSMQGESSSSGVSSATTVAYTGDVLSDTEDGTNNALRRRVNPMYEALEQSATRLYAQTCHCKTQSSAHRQLRYLWCAFIVLIVVVIFLLCVVAYVLFMLVPGLKSHVHDQGDKINFLETGYGKLLQENQELLQIFSTNKSTSETLAGSIVETISHLNSSVGMFGSQLHDVSNLLQQQITNIALTPGPQGPPGVGNLSMCVYTSHTSYQKLPGPYSTTDWVPSTEELEDNIVMSAMCGVIGGTQQFVEAKQTNPNSVQYRCRCDGSVDDEDRRACKIHLVMCPRLFQQNNSTMS